MKTIQTIQPNETALIEAAQRGDLDAFNELILKFQDMMYRIALRTLNDPLLPMTPPRMR